MLLKKLKVVKAIIIRTCKELKRKNGTTVQFDDNVVVIINQEGNPKSTHFLVQSLENFENLNLSK
jgi:large subunit ribosomal protein L14